RTRGRIAVAFDEPPPDWATEGRVVLELLPSSVTYDRLAGALRRIAEAQRWHGPLREEPLRFAAAAPGPDLPQALNPEPREALQLRAAARKQRARRGPGRYSESRAQEREARSLLAEAREREDRAEADVLERAPVVLATLTGLESNALRDRRFDLGVIDEATQAVEPAIYLALLKSQRAVLAGDHLQLPPTVLSEAAQKGGLAISLFEQLAAARPEAKITLAEQYRMNERIMRYPSDALYGGRLRSHPSVARHALDEAPLEVIDTAGRGFEEETPEGSESKANRGEADLATEEVQRLFARGVAPRDVAVIAPYDAQVQLLRQRLAAHPDVEVDTVDGFQGREKEAIVVSLTRSN